jgi:hypothetical protein
VIDPPARSRMIYAFGSDGVSSWMVEEIHNRLFRSDCGSPAAATTRCR